MPVGYELFDKVNVRSGDRWFEGCITDFIHDYETVFIIVDYVNTDMLGIAQAIINMSYVNNYLRN